MKTWNLASVAGLALGWSVVSSLSTYPHSLSYFNKLVGGPEGGHAHLDNSNIDWGQDLLNLKRWLDAHPHARPLGLLYFGNLDPRIAGIDFSLPPPGLGADGSRPGLSEREIGPLPGWYAVSVNYLRGRIHSVVSDGNGGRVHLEKPAYTYFLRFEPEAMAGYSIYIYHITVKQANRVRAQMGLSPVEDLRTEEDHHDTGPY